MYCMLRYLYSLILLIFVYVSLMYTVEYIQGDCLQRDLDVQY